MFPYYCIFVICFLQCIHSLEFYVSQSYGNDNNSGLSKKDAFKTLNRAKIAIRDIEKTENVYVNIDAGNYEESLYFTHLDSGNINGYIEWRSYPNIDKNLVEISGGKKIDKSSFYSCNSPFDINSNIDLLCANLSSLGITKYDIGSMISGGLIDCQHNKLQLFYNNLAQILSRYPNINNITGLYEWTLITEALNDTTFRYKNSMNHENIASWSQELNPWMHGYWSNDWFDTYTKLDDIIYDNKDNTYYISSYNNPNFGPLSNARFYGVNMLSELDMKSEYYLDETSLILYWYPPTNNHKDELINDIVISIKDYVIKLTQNVSYLSFNDLTISYSKITGIYTEGGKDVNFNINVTNINITNCMINNHGNNGVDINGQNLFVFNNSVENMGCKGLSVVGGNYYTLTSANNLIKNNNITNFSIWKRSYMPGLFWGGIGNIYSYNNIKYGPHNGILGGGNQVSPKTNLGGCNNIFEYNYIKNTTYEVSDSGSFYTCGQEGNGWINRGNIIRHNIFENIRHLTPLYAPSGDVAPIEGIYLDDQSSGWIVENNTLINCQGGILIGGGRRNSVLNNYCNNVDICVHLDNRGMTWEPDPCTPPNGTLWQGLYSVNYQNEPWLSAYNIDIDSPCVPVHNIIENNRYCGLNTTFASFTKQQAISWNDTVDNNIYKCN